MLLYHGRRVFVLLIWILTVRLIFQSYFYNDDTFNFNYAQAKAATGCFNEAEEVRVHFL